MSRVRPRKLIPARKFRLYPSANTRLYFECYIWNKLSELHCVHRMICGRTNHGHRVRGLVERCRHWENNRLTPLLGEIHLHLHHLGGGVVSHEMLHAAIGFHNRKQRNLNLTPDPLIRGRKGKPRPCNDNEEQLCYALEYLIRNFYRKCERNGVLKATNQKVLH